MREWIEKAKEDRPVWISEVRDTWNREKNTFNLAIELTLYNDRKKQWTYYVPVAKDVEEQEFVRRFLYAETYNALAAYSATKVTFYADKNDTELWKLLYSVPEKFQCTQRQRTGYGKVINIADRINRTFGKTVFSFVILGLEEYIPVSVDSEKEKRLSDFLQDISEKEQGGLYAGLDVGGTDVKLAISYQHRLCLVKEMDWNPAMFCTASEFISTLTDFIRKAKEEVAGNRLFDAIGISFPDVVIEDRVVGGETPKMKGIREHAGEDYEAEFFRITQLRTELSSLCRDVTGIHMTNDGHMAAFTAAMEMCAGKRESLIEEGVLAFSLGTDLGSGWIQEDGSILPIPFELYDFILDLGSEMSGNYPAADLRSTKNENSGLPGLRRYTGQVAAFRLAYKKNPKLLEGYLIEEEGVIKIQGEPKDLRKPCLEHLMRLAEEGDVCAQEIFLEIGENLGKVNLELEHFFRIKSDIRFLFGRFVKRDTCFKLLQKGAFNVVPKLQLMCADENMAYTPLMSELGKRKDTTVAQAGQAAGAIYYGLRGKEE